MCSPQRSPSSAALPHLALLPKLHLSLLHCACSMAFRVLGAAGLVLGLHILRRVASGRAAAPKPLGEGETEVGSQEQRC